MATMRSIVASLKVRITFTTGERPDSKSWGAGAMHYRVTVHHARKRMTVWYSHGSAICADPTAEDVLGCLASDASAADQDFPEWCAEYGYTDPGEAYKTWQACRKTRDDLARVFGRNLSRVLSAEW